MAQIWRWFECQGARDINQMPQALDRAAQLRSGPSAAVPFKPGHVVNSGQWVYVSARSHEWFHVHGYGEDRITCGWIRAQYLGGSVDLVLLNGRFTPLLSSRSRWWCYRTMPDESLKFWVRSRDVHVWYSLQSVEEIQTQLALSPDHAASDRRRHCGADRKTTAWATCAQRFQELFAQMKTCSKPPSVLRAFSHSRSGRRSTTCTLAFCICMAPRRRRWTTLYSASDNQRKGAPRQILHRISCVFDL